MTYNWSVERIRYEQSSGRITHLHWKLLVTSGSDSLTKEGSVYLPDDPTIPFDSVTQLLLMNWLQDRMDITTPQSEIQLEASAILTRMLSPTYITTEAPA
mgnify:FL=1|tara:strand:- start:1324 stop:1623 length:300 start_codon:yes stop_codon:yes gene_type:complete